MEMLNVNGLDLLLTKLSEILGITTDAIQNNAMEYILMYGKYKLFVTVTILIALGIMFGALFIIIGIFYNEGFLEMKTNIKIMASTIGIMIILGIFEIITYLVNPLMYSIASIMHLVN